MKKVIVQFLKTASPYQKGEIAGFDENVAQRLIDDKTAVEYKEPKKARTGASVPPLAQGSAGGENGGAQSSGGGNDNGGAQRNDAGGSDQ